MGEESTGVALVDTGGRFMTGPEMDVAGEPLHLPGPALYLRGRVGALGEVPADVAEAVLAIFPTVAVHGTWSRTGALPAVAAVAAYASACHAWGRRYLGDLDGGLAERAEEVVDAADVSALALTAAWRRQPRPVDAPARAAHAVMLLRELRGGLHFCALRASGVPVPLGTLADPRGGAARLRRTGWPADVVDALVARAADVPDLAERWRQAEATTDATFGACLDVLDAADRGRLADGIRAAEELSRASAPAHQRARLEDRT